MNPKSKTTTRSTTTATIARQATAAAEKALDPIARKAALEKLSADPRFRTLPEPVKDVASMLTPRALEELLVKFGGEPGASPAERVKNAPEGSQLATMAKSMGATVRASAAKPRVDQHGRFFLPTGRPTQAAAKVAK